MDALCAMLFSGVPELFYGIGAQFLQTLNQLGHRICEELSFASTDPPEPDPILRKPHLLQDPFEDGQSSAGLIISRLIMTVSWMAPPNQNSVRSIDESLEDINGIDGSRAHQMDDADIGGILLPSGPGQVRSRIGAPVAKKGYNPRFKLSHFQPP